MKLILNSVFLAALIFGSGCATIIRDGSQPVAFTSDPAGATIALNSIDRGVTPATIVIKRSTRDTIVSYNLKDFHPVEFVLDRHMGGATLGNLLLGGGVGLLVDAASGKNATYPDNINIDMTPLSEPKPPPPTFDDGNKNKKVAGKDESDKPARKR